MEDATVLPGPIFNMELLTSARRTRYFFIRAIYATILLIALGLVYQSFTQSYSNAAVDIRMMARLSAAFFGVLSWLQLLLVFLLGPAMVAGTIATERERRTIEYLFASRLSNAEIVLGKLAARIVHVVYMVLTGVPILALMMLLGGIAPEELLALTVVTLCSVLTISTLSIAVSVWSARAREAVTRTYLVVFALTALPPIMISLLRVSPFWHRLFATVLDPFLTANPFVMLTSVMAAASGTMRGAAFDMVLVFARNHLIVSFILAALATWGVRRAHLTQTTKAARRRRRFSHFFRPSVGQRPMLWKEIFAEPAAARLGWIGRVAATLIVLGVIGPTICVFFGSLTHTNSYRPASRDYLEYAVWMGTLLGCGGLLLVAARAAGSITSEKERDCWTSLLSTPLEPVEIVWAKIAGSVWSLRGLILLLLLIWGLGVLLDPSFLIAVPFLFGMFLLLAFYAAALGVRFSLRCRNSLRSMAATLVTAIFVGGGYLCCCMPVLIASRAGHESILIVAGFVPYLLALPGVAYVENEHFFRSSEAAPMLFAYIAGAIGYSIAAIVLTGSSISSFDRLAGRTGPRGSTSSPALPPRPPAASPREMPAEAILLPPSSPEP